MKDLVFAIVLTLTTTISVVGQKLLVDSLTGKVTFRQVVELDSTYKANTIFSLVKEWFSVNNKTFNRSNSDKNFSTGDVLFGTERKNSAQIDQLHKNDQPLKLQDPSDKKIIGKGVLKYTGSSMGCLRVLYLDYDIIVLVKDSKYKIEISNLTYTHYNQMSMKQSQLYGWKDEGACGSKNTIENLLNCERCKGEFEKFYTYLSTDTDSLIGDLKTYLTNNRRKDSNW